MNCQRIGSRSRSPMTRAFKLPSPAMTMAFMAVLVALEAQA